MTYLTVEENLKQFLQRNIRIQIGEKVLREGRLILFNLKDYHLVFTIKIKGRNKNYELPYPFVNILKNENCLVFDYQLKHLHNNDPMLLKHKIFTPSKKSKLWNNIVTINAYDL